MGATFFLSCFDLQSMYYVRYSSRITGFFSIIAELVISTKFSIQLINFHFILARGFTDPSLILP